MKLGNDVFLFYEVAKFILKFAICFSCKFFTIYTKVGYQRVSVWVAWIGLGFNNYRIHRLLGWYLLLSLLSKRFSSLAKIPLDHKK